MLTSYPAIVKNGQIQFQEPVNLPEGAEVMVVVGPPRRPETTKTTEEQENYALNQAMNEARREPALNREQALAFLNTED